MDAGGSSKKRGDETSRKLQGNDCSSYVGRGGSAGVCLQTEEGWTSYSLISLTNHLTRSNLGDEDFISTPGLSVWSTKVSGK